jgi:hypothetical protein
LKTLLLRRMGSSIYAGRRTTEKMLATWGTGELFAERSGGVGDEAVGADGDDGNDGEPRNAVVESEMKNLKR